MAIAPHACIAIVVGKMMIGMVAKKGGAYGALTKIAFKLIGNDGCEEEFAKQATR